MWRDSDFYMKPRSRPNAQSPLHPSVPVAFFFLFSVLCFPISASPPPAIPIGLDAYRQWERWPYLRIGARTYMRSTYDRKGGNEGADDEQAWSEIRYDACCF